MADLADWVSLDKILVDPAHTTFFPSIQDSGVLAFDETVGVGLISGNSDTGLGVGDGSFLQAIKRDQVTGEWFIGPRFLEWDFYNPTRSFPRAQAAVPLGDYDFIVNQYTGPYQSNSSADYKLYLQVITVDPDSLAITAQGTSSEIYSYSYSFENTQETLWFAGNPDLGVLTTGVALNSMVLLGDGRLLVSFGGQDTYDAPTHTMQRYHITDIYTVDGSTFTLQHRTTEDVTALTLEYGGSNVPQLYYYNCSTQSNLVFRQLVRYTTVNNPPYYNDLSAVSVNIDGTLSYGSVLTLDIGGQTFPLPPISDQGFFFIPGNPSSDPGNAYTIGGSFDGTAFIVNYNLLMPVEADQGLFEFSGHYHRWYGNLLWALCIDNANQFSWHANSINALTGETTPKEAFIVETDSSVWSYQQPLYFSIQDGQVNTLWTYFVGTAPVTGESGQFEIAALTFPLDPASRQACDVRVRYSQGRL